MRRERERWKTQTCRVKKHVLNVCVERKTDTNAATRLPEEPHLLVLLFIIADDFGGGHTHLHAVNNILSGSLKSLTGKARILWGSGNEKGGNSNTWYKA